MTTSLRLNQPVSPLRGKVVLVKNYKIFIRTYYWKKLYLSIYKGLDPLFFHFFQARRGCDLSYQVVNIERPCLSWSQSALLRKRGKDC